MNKDLNVKQTQLCVCVCVCSMSWRFISFLTCDLGLDLALHLQRLNIDAAVTDEAGAGYASVRLAEPLFIKIHPERHKDA